MAAVSSSSTPSSSELLTLTLGRGFSVSFFFFGSSMLFLDFRGLMKSSNQAKKAKFSILLSHFSQPWMMFQIYLSTPGLSCNEHNGLSASRILSHRGRGSGGGATRALARPLFFGENNIFYQIKRFNSLAKMSVHKDTLDSLSVIHIAATRSGSWEQRSFSG